MVAEPAAAVTTWVAAEAATLGVVTKIEVPRDLATIMEAILAAAAVAAAETGETNSKVEVVEIMDLATIKAILEVRIGVDFVDF